MPLAGVVSGVRALGDRLLLVQEEWPNDGTWEKLNAALRERLRVRLGRDTHPSARIVMDSQSTKTAGVGDEQRGYDGGKKVQGRKRHLLVDTEGLLLKAKVHSAKLPDEDGSKSCYWSLHAVTFRVSGTLRVEAGYRGRGKRWAEEGMGLSAEGGVRRPRKPVPEEVARIWTEEEWAKEGRKVHW